MTIVLDCNIWLSLALTKQIAYLDNIIATQTIDIATCKELIDEITDVSRRPKFRKYFTLSHAEDLVLFHLSLTQQFEITSIPKVVSDDKDNYLFALCEVSQANYFVTGDKLLLEVGAYKQTSIITLADFKRLVDNFL